MATASSFLSEDQLLCSICLDVFTEPVSIPCGHNFCKDCLTKHWAGKDQCQCPLCNEKFNKGLKLRVNIGFREVVENFKTHHVTADNNSQVKPGQVPCDCCLGNKFKASKTCLVCLVSFCETHLEPHQRVAALKRHKLTNPVHNLEGKICKKHNRILEFFCKTDQTHACALCTEHIDHDTVPLEEEYVDKRAQMRKEKVNVPEIKQKQGKMAQKMKVAVQNKKKGKNGAKANSMASNQMFGPPPPWFPSEELHHLSEYSYIPENRGLSGGRFYYEIPVEGMTDWVLGVVTESVQRKKTSRLDPRNGDWIVRFVNNNCSCPYCLSVLRRKPERVLLFVDYEQGHLIFYDPDTAIVMYSVAGLKFNERIFLFFQPSEDVSYAQRIRKKFQLMSKDPDLYYILFVFTVMLLVSVWISHVVYQSLD